MAINGAARQITAARSNPYSPDEINIAIVFCFVAEWFFSPNRDGIAEIMSAITGSVAALINLAESE